MGIQSTIDMTRDSAISRIKMIHYFIRTKNYRELEDRCYEPGNNIKDFINSHEDFDIENLENYTNGMLEEIMDRPLYRGSMFDNYNIV